jgi:phosphodiesterase/alkaline phosphatase D-like protein
VVAWVLAVAPLAAQSGSPFVSGVWSGNITASSATVCVRLNAPGLRVRLVVSPNAGLSPAVFSAEQTTSAANGNVVALPIAGLQPATEYDYGIEVGGTLRPEPGARGHLRTFPRGAASFRLAFASCGDFRDADQRAFDALVAEQPLLLLHMGDLHYSDTNATDPELYRANYDAVLNHRNQGQLYRSVGLAYMWDDHDFGGDDSNGTAIGTETARAVYRDYVPHYPLTVPDGTIAQAFTVGRVRVIMTDLRSASAPPTDPESPTKSRLGGAQKTWFKQELLSARDAGFPLILWLNTDPWIAAPQAGADTWGGYATERTELANFIRDSRIRSIVMLSGDMHALAYDDGTHSDYATGGGAPLVVLHAAPLTRPPNIKGGPYSAGPLLGVGQYGLIDITDNGGATLQCRFTAKRVGEGVKLGLQFSAATTGIVVGGATNSGDRSFVNVSTRGRLTAPGDAVIAGFVLGGAANHDVLIRAVGPTLAAFGIADPLARPVLTVYRGSTVVASNDDWTLADAGRLGTTFERVGAFGLADTAAHDAALVVNLAPGAYTIQATGASGSFGTVLLEAYDLQ